MAGTQACGVRADDGVMDTGLLQSIDQQTRLAGYNRLALLIFSLGGQATFGINVFKVREVLPMPALQQLPRAHPLVRGIFDCRGVVMPVVDLAAALGLAGGQPASHVVVTEFNRRLQAFAVGGVERGQSRGRAVGEGGSHRRERSDPVDDALRTAPPGPVRVPSHPPL